MDTIDPMVLALVALCKSEGGEKFVADKAKVSAANLAQITKGVKLPSGHPRGVGPGLRAKLSLAYPGWIAQSATANLILPTLTGAATGSAQNNPPALVNTASAAINGIARLDCSIDCLAAYLAEVDPSKRAAVTATMAAVIADPSDLSMREALVKMLTPAAFASHQKAAA